MKTWTEIQQQWNRPRRPGSFRDLAEAMKWELRREQEAAREAGEQNGNTGRGPAFGAPLMPQSEEEPQRPRFDSIRKLAESLRQAARESIESGEENNEYQDSLSRPHGLEPFIMRLLRKLLVIIGVLLSPVILFYAVLFFTYSTVDPLCDRILKQQFSSEHHFRQKEVEQRILSGFRKIDNPDFKTLHSVTRIYMETYRKKDKPVHVVSYNKYFFYRCFEIIYAPDGEILNIIAAYD